MNPYSKREIVIKIAFISLVFLLSGSLFTSGSMASEDCGINSPLGMQSSGENPRLCIVGCNLGDEQSHCQAQCSQPVEMPNIVLVPSGGFHSDFYGLSVAPVKAFDGLLYPEDDPNFLFSKKAVVFPPLFLMNQSFII